MKSYAMQVRTPCYVVEESLLIKNLEVLKSVIDRTGCRILLAQKGFSMYAAYPLIGRYLNGTTASSLFEARLGREEMGGETHIFSPAFRDDEIEEIARTCCHIVFNTPNQFERFAGRAKSVNPDIQLGLRVNPEYSEVEVELYNPCAKGSRLGTTLSRLGDFDVSQLDGIHFHTMCEQNSDTLDRTLGVVEEKFGHLFHKVKWVNFGGGHHITRPDYDIELLERCITNISTKYSVQVYLEPGEAIPLNTGFLVSEVLDIVENDGYSAILDTSAACHMPDVLEMPYRPIILGSDGDDARYSYRLGGPTCLSGDVIGRYSFAEPLKIGDRLVFTDMGHFTMVKNNTFNGLNLPSIYYARADGSLELIKEFGYEDFKRRL